MKKPINFSLTCLALSLSLIAGSTQAISFGTYDARSLAMGGTGTAVGKPEQAAFYNPALLGFHNKDEDDSRDGRFYMPILLVQASDSVETAADAYDDNLEDRLSQAVGLYNQGQAQAAASGVSNVARDLRRTLNDIAGKDLNLDGFVGLSVSEPSLFEGGALYIGARFMAVGASTVADSDMELLDRYIEAMDSVAAGTDPAIVIATYPDLFDGNGNLIDTTTNLTSSADVGALAIGEWGVALGKSWDAGDHKIALGVTPKLMRVDAFRDSLDFTAETQDVGNTEEAEDSFSDTRTTHTSFNMDLGISAKLFDHYIVSLAAKDLFKKSFDTKGDPDPITGEATTGLPVKLTPRYRLGLAYVKNALSIGLDYDLKESEPMARELGTQELSLGAEYMLFNSLALRAGYKTDQGEGGASSSSFGIGWRLNRFVVDAAYSTGGDLRAGALQLGWTF
jgi:hypothetical protein